MKGIYYMLVSGILLLAGTVAAAEAGRERMRLDGKWHSTFGDCSLPGIPEKAAGQHHRRGRQWIMYHRTVNVPSSFAGRRLRLVLERAGETTLWVDGDSIGSFSHPALPHIYELPPLAGNKAEVSLKASDGIYGNMYLEAYDSTYISDVVVEPDAESCYADVKVSVESVRAGKAHLRLCVNPAGTGDRDAKGSVQYEVSLAKGSNEFRYRMEVADPVSLWSEFHPDMYRLDASLTAMDCSDRAECVFAVRDLTVENGYMSVNGNRVFLRGVKYAGAAGEGRRQMKEWWWRMLFSRAAEKGINYWQVCSYSLPEEAFAAADAEGVFISSDDASIGHRHPSYIGCMDGIELVWIGRKDNAENYMEDIDAAMGEDCGGFLLPDAESCTSEIAALKPIAYYGKQLLTQGDTLNVKVCVANYTETDWSGQVEWSVAADELLPATKETLPVFSGRIDSTVPQGHTEQAGRVFLPVSMLGLKEGETCRLTLTLSIGEHKSIYVFRAGSQPHFL
ncbi:MAG: hypothetical protein NC115_03345 [Bacteroidales bacterium]|nr:hypothetical protein [Bacteroidales bacterium]